MSGYIGATQVYTQRTDKFWMSRMGSGFNAMDLIKKTFPATIIITLFLAFPLFQLIRLSADIERELVVKGFGWDIFIISITCFFISLSSSRISVFLILALFLKFSLIQYGNFEFISVFGRPVESSQLKYLADITFIRGSLLQEQTILISLIFFFLFITVWISLNTMERRARLHTFGAMAILGIAAGVTSPVAKTTPNWMQTGLFIQNSKNILQTAVFSSNSYSRLLADEFILLDEEFAGDLSGSRWVEPYEEYPNIILVMLEGVAGAYMPNIATRHGLQSSIQMNKLQDFADKGINLTQFFTHQRQTNRGTYALLCGDFPRFSAETAKMTAIALQNNSLDCLPSKLSDLGYHTEYFQAAPLIYANKDRALPLMGYEAAVGSSAFNADEVGSGWGPNDWVFFDRAVDRIAELRAGERPYFVTLLNVGTHHPYDTVPRDFQSELDRKGRSFEFLDLAFGDFIERLESAGLLENTMVIITSDESSGLDGDYSEGVYDLFRNWGMLVVVDPDKFPATVRNDPAGQIDLPLSILDVLGEDGGNKFKGRSLFRNYEESRTIPAFNNVGNFYFEISSDWIDICEDTASRCRRFERPTLSFGDVAHSPLEDTEFIKNRANAVIEFTNKVSSDFDVALFAPGTEVERSISDNYFICCQYLNLKSGSIVKFDMQVELLVDEPVQFIVDAVSKKNGDFQNHHVDVRNAQPGDVMDFAFYLNLPELSEDFEVRARVKFDSPDDVRFRVHHADLNVRSLR